MALRFLVNLLRKTPTIVQLTHRGVLSVSGSQAPEFLNGLLSTSVSKGPLYSAFLHAQACSDIYMIT